MNEQYTRAPHRRSTGPVGASPNAALMIDFDNVTMAIRSNLGQELRNFLNSDIIRGKVSVQRAYADWRRYPQYIVPLSEASIDLIFAPAYGSSKKNATDIRLAIDALELVFTRPEIGTFILLSGDSDFSSLVLKLKEYGKYVIGVGLQESTSDLLVQNCDEYYSYNSLSGLTEASQLETIRHDPWELVEIAVKRMAERDDVMRSDRLKQVMLEMDPGFDEKEYGYSKFNRFLAEASSKGLLRLQRIENGQYEVAPADGVRSAGRGGERRRRGRRGGRERESRGGKAETSQARAPARETPAPAGIEASALKRGYDLLRDVVAALSGDGGSVRDSEVKRALLERDEHFDEAALGFSKFSRFLRQASDEGVVDLETDEDGNYHVSVSDGGAPPARAAEPRESRRARGRERGDRRRPEREGRRERAEEAPEPMPTEPEAAPRAPEPRAEEAAAEERPAAASAAAESMVRSRGEGAGEGEGEPSAAEAAESGPGEEHRGRGRRGRGLGRFRRGSRGAPVDGQGSGPLPGPADGGERGGSEAAREPAEPAAPGGSASPAPGESSRRGSARVGLGARTGRRGSGGTSRPVSGSGRGETEAGPSTGPGHSDDPQGTGGAVDHMVRNYAGVGRKTAEALVAAFGEDVFTVIDQDPGRITSVVPEHRAQAVIEAREAERRDDGSAAT
jgi:uncharacterized protein (TIGR00288 family)